MTIENSRVKNVLPLRVNGKRVKIRTSRLWIDGEQHPTMPERDFYALFNNPEAFLAPTDAGEAVDAPDLPPAADPAAAPAFLRRQADKHGMAFEVGATEHMWTARTTGHRDGALYLFQITIEYANGEWYVLEPFIVKDGRTVDVGDIPEGLIDYIRALLNGPGSKNAQPAQAKTSGPRGVQGIANSLTVRNSTVFRI